MADISQYIDWRGDISLRVSPFNEVDALILTQLAMIDLDGIVPSVPNDDGITVADAAERFFNEKKRGESPLGLIIPPEIIPMFKKMSQSRRYSKMKLCAYVNRVDTRYEQQFSALTVRMGDGSFFVSFRGTDDTIVGWKEDLNLSFLDVIPSQNEAVAYFNEICRFVRGTVRVGGHSKGGNLAVYAAVMCKEKYRKRIKEVYSFDGPGFRADFIASAAYTELSDRIKNIVPQSSVVGMLFENGSPYSIVKSTETGLMQHNPFSWETARDRFVSMPELTPKSKKAVAEINELIRQLDVDARKRFADAVYRALTSTNASTLTEMYKDRFNILRSLSKTDKETRRLMLKMASILSDDNGSQVFGVIVNGFFKGKNDAEQKKK